jgi:hypothetical protein
MTVEAPFHPQGMFLANERHFIHAPVARAAADAFLHMNSVIEENEIGRVMNSIPFDGPARGPTITHRLQHGRIGPHLRMAGHARLGGRHAGRTPRLDGGVAIAAIDSQPAIVMLVAEGRRLIQSDPLARHVRRPPDSAHANAGQHNEKDHADHAPSRTMVCVRLKDLTPTGTHSLNPEIQINQTGSCSPIG